MTMPAFHWLSRSVEPPARWDIRLLGWRLLDDRPVDAIDGRAPAILDFRPGQRAADWRTVRHPEAFVAIGVAEPEERAALIAAGFGDALGWDVALAELGARLLRLEAFARALPRQRRAGPLVLDLLQRDARLGERWLGLDARGFALLWRLAETPHVAVSRRELIGELWPGEAPRAGAAIETVVARLRLALAAIDGAWLVASAPSGGYRLGGEGRGGFGAFPALRREALDSARMIGNAVRLG